MKKLTDKQEHFSQLVVKYGNQSKAYREAYNVKEGTTDKSVSEQASTLANDLTVSSRIEELRKESRDISKIDRQWILDQHREVIDWYKEVKELARREPLTKEEKSRVFMLKELIKGSDFRGSLDSITKMLGFNAPDKLEIKDTTFKTNWGE